MPNNPDDTNQLPVTPLSPDSVESQFTRVVDKTQEEVIALLEKKIATLESNITELRVENDDLNNEIDNLNHKLSHDVLTDLRNRYYLVNWMKDNIDQNSTFVMLSMDLNKFKPINDKYWHPIGDKALKLMADVIREVIRETINKDIEWFITRTGGDEFVGIFNWEVDSMLVAERIRTTLEGKFNKWVISHDGNDIRNIPFTASIWIASNTDIDSYLEHLKKEHEKALDQNMKELADIDRSIAMQVNNGSKSTKEILDGNRKLIEGNRKKLEETFQEIVTDTNYGITWKVSELALKFAKKAVNHIRVYDKNCLLSITDSPLVDKLVEDLESGMRNVKDTESAIEFCDNMIKIMQEFLLKISK